MDSVVRLLRGEVPRGEIGLVKAVTGHDSTLEKFAGFFEKGAALRMGGLVAEAGKVFQSLFLGGVEVLGNLDANADM